MNLTNYGFRITNVDLIIFILINFKIYTWMSEVESGWKIENWKSLDSLFLSNSSLFNCMKWSKWIFSLSTTFIYSVLGIWKEIHQLIAKKRISEIGFYQDGCWVRERRRRNHRETIDLNYMGPCILSKRVWYYIATTSLDIIYTSYFFLSKRSTVKKIESWSLFGWATSNLSDLYCLLYTWHNICYIHDIYLSSFK